MLPPIRHPKEITDSQAYEYLVAWRNEDPKARDFVIEFAAERDADGRSIRLCIRGNHAEFFGDTLAIVYHRLMASGG